MRNVAVRRATRVFITYLIAVTGAYILGVIASTQFVLAQLAELGHGASNELILRTISHDILGMAPTYGIILLITLGIAFSVASFIGNFFPRLRASGLVIGSGLAVVAVHLIMQEVFSISPLYSAGSMSGILTQGFAGSVGGFFYYLMRRT